MIKENAEIGFDIDFPHQEELSQLAKSAQSAMHRNDEYETVVLPLLNRILKISIDAVTECKPEETESMLHRCSLFWVEAHACEVDVHVFVKFILLAALNNQKHPEQSGTCIDDLRSAFHGDLLGKMRRYPGMKKKT